MHATRAQAGKPLDISVLQAPWQALKSVAHLRPIRSEADHDRMVTMMITLLDVGVTTKIIRFLACLNLPLI